MTKIVASFTLVIVIWEKLLFFMDFQLMKVLGHTLSTDFFSSTISRLILTDKRAKENPNTMNETTMCIHYKLNLWLQKVLYSHSHVLIISASLLFFFF